MKRFFQFLFRHKKTTALLLCALVAAAVFHFLPRSHKASTNPNVTTPAIAVDAMQAWNPKSVYFTVSAYNYLSAKKPEWIPPWVTADKSQQGFLDLYHAGQDPALWRRLDHQYHFDVVLLSGEPSEYRPLLEHLVESVDWKLAYLDHTSIIFRRAPAPQWTLQDFQALVQKFANYPAPDRAAFFTLVASKLLAIGQPALAKQQLDASLSIDPNSTETWTQMSLYELQMGKPHDALDDTDRALKIDKDDYDALRARAKILFAMKRFSDALNVSNQLLQSHPDDQGVIFFHSMIAHQARAYSQEIQALRHLIDLALAEKQPVAGFRIYLAQAYARDGQGQPALDEFQKALDEGNLSADQHKFILDTIKVIKGQISPDDGSKVTHDPGEAGK